ncbi:MAG: hypothetical protein JWM85_3471 [Acidimicrobiaceae bacterium]|nr:hypothetical protein [Acidimicrobiaceae bacterium]
MFDLEPATRTLSDLVAGVRDDQLSGQTPCSDTTIGDLIDHIDSFALAFAGAAAKSLPPGSQGPSADMARLGTEWRARVPRHLEALALAWREQSAWSGRTAVGGVELPGDVAGLFALNEVIVHGWDLAVASGQRATYEPQLVEAVLALVESTVAGQPEGRQGLFGPAVAVSEGAPSFDRLLGLTGRDPAWNSATCDG